MGQQSIVGFEYSAPSGGVLRVVGMAERGRQGQQRALIECSICHADKELWPEPLARDVGSIRNKVVSCGCSKSTQWTEQQLPIVIRRLVDGWAELVSVGEFKKAATRFVLRCPEDGGEWETDLKNIRKAPVCPFCAHGRWTEQKARDAVERDGRYLYRGFIDGRRAMVSLECPHDGHQWDMQLRYLTGRQSSCPMCTNQIPLTDQQVEERIAARGDVDFLAHLEKSEHGRRRVRVRCKIDGQVWECQAAKLMHGETGCPQCSRPGFDPHLPGFVYVNHWEGKGLSFVKFGITNNQLEGRIKSQAKESGLTCVTAASFRFGRGADAARLERQLIQRQKEHWGRAATKEQFPDGYTETIPAEFRKEALDMTVAFLSAL